MTKEMTDEQRQHFIARWRDTGMAISMNIQLIEFGNGRAVVEGFPSSKFYNAKMLLHGGYVATLVDSGLGCAVQSVLGGDALFGTVNLHVHYVRKINEATGRLLCTGNVVHAGRTMLTAEAKVADEAGRLYAHGTGTFLVYPS